VQIELKITLDTDTGSMQVTGPINDLGFCYSLLELAKDFLRMHTQQQVAERKIIAPNFQMPRPM
jgi:hypothetical protein